MLAQYYVSFQLPQQFSMNIKEGIDKGYNGPKKLDNMLSYSKVRKMEVQGYYESEVRIGI